MQEGIDVALRTGVQANSSLTARRLGCSPRFVIGAPSYFERVGTPTAPPDLLGHEGVIYIQDGEKRAWPFRRRGAETSVTLKGRFKVSAAEGVRAAVMAGLGFTVASAWMFPELRSGEVTAVLTDWELPPVDLWAVFPTGRVATSKARAFVSFAERSLPHPTGHGLKPPAPPVRRHGTGGSSAYLRRSSIL